MNRAELKQSNPAALEARTLRDTYATFGCENTPPTYRYDLKSGARDGFLVTPKIYDARTEITTQLLSETGAAFQHVNPETGDTDDLVFHRRDYERKLFRTRPIGRFARRSCAMREKTR